MALEWTMDMLANELGISKEQFMKSSGIRMSYWQGY